MSLPVSPPLRPFPPEKSRAGPTGRPRPLEGTYSPQSGGEEHRSCPGPVAGVRAWCRGSDSRPCSQPPVTFSRPPGATLPPFSLGGVWMGLPLPRLRVTWEFLGIWIQPALDLEVR